jgi:hypothetical protein
MWKALLLNVIFFLALQSVSAESKISLKLDCEKGPDCSPREWFLLDQFDLRFVEEPNFHPNDTWKSTTEFPIWLNQHFKNNESLGEYTLFTKFQINQLFWETNRSIGIRFGEIGEVFTIYINGKKIFSEGKVKDGKVEFHRTVRGRVYEIPKSYLNLGDNRLVIHLQGDPRFDHTGFYLKFGYDIGFFDDLKKEMESRLELALILVYLVIGYYHLLLYFKRRKEQENLYFASYCIGLSIYLITRTTAIFEWNIDSVLIQRAELFVLFPMSSLLLLFHDFLFNKKLMRFNLLYFFFSASLSIPILFVPMYIAEHILRFWQLMAFLVSLPLGFVIFIKAIRKDITYARRLFTFFLLFNISPAIFDILDSAIFNTGLAITKYSFFFYILGLFTVLANKFVLLHNETEELNTNLEKKVEERTTALSSSLQIVQDLKKQQDGDYFLTSLLIRSLISNQSLKSKIQIEFRIKQKKQFEFQKHKSEIGGDLCRAEDILLNLREFSVFFNADAMGKSIQGAGGALVLGAVFDAILERTFLNKMTHSNYPERWLKNTILELHKVFESFDGSMLVSIVIGIIDKETGHMLYFNAEHPAPVLFRDGEASFLGEEDIGRKLGSPLTGNFLLIQSFTLLPGDVLLVGSDGRDDIIMGNQEMDSDEKKFLTLVKEKQGDLDSIFSYYTSQPEILTDDLSLMSVQLEPGFIPEYLQWDKDNLPELPQEAEACEKLWEQEKAKNKKNPYLLKKLSQYFLNQNHYDLAYTISNECISMLPEDIELIYQTSVLAMRTGNYQEAIEQGERVRVREPLHFDNLANLGQSYLLAGIKDRVMVILDLFDDFAPTHEFAQELKSRLKEKS